jgi:hypothetical protein
MFLANMLMSVETVVSGGTLTLEATDSGKGTGTTLSVAVLAGDMVIGLAHERSSTTNLSMSGFTTEFYEYGDVTRYAAYGYVVTADGTFNTTLTGNTSSHCIALVFRGSSAPTASPSHGVTTGTSATCSWSPLAGFAIGDIALAVGAVDNGGLFAATPILTADGYTGVGQNPRVGVTDDGDLQASYVVATSSGSYPPSAITEAMAGSNGWAGTIIRIPS